MQVHEQLTHFAKAMLQQALGACFSCKVMATIMASKYPPCCYRLQIFFASVGASGSIAVVLRTAPSLFLWSTIAISSEECGMLCHTVYSAFCRQELLLAAVLAFAGLRLSHVCCAAAHLAIMLGGERLFGFTRKESSLASNANIGGACWRRCWLSVVARPETGGLPCPACVGVENKK
jgi:hypothetical protein